MVAELSQVIHDLTPALRRLLLWPHLGGTVVDRRAGHRARREIVRADFADRSELGAGAGDKAFLETGELA